MRHKCILLCFILFLISCSNENISNNEVVVSSNIISSDIISNDTIISSGITSNEIKEKISYTSYVYEEFMSEENKLLECASVNSGSIMKYIDDSVLPDFRLCGDRIIMRYYGEIIADDVTLTTPDGDYWYLEGEIVDIEYISASIGKVEISIGQYNDGTMYCSLNDKQFKYIVTDKDYHFCSVSDFDINETIYASYYDGIPYALYSFNPLV